MNKAWWKEAVVYQIYPRSFMDSNGDGIGDLNGITEKLWYIKELGCDVIWLCPVYDSPNDDNGYDIRDYKKIMDEFGNLDDFVNLLQKAHSLGIKIIMDLVVNHTSDENKWFIESKTSKSNPCRGYYIWKEGKGKKAPNNWGSVFGGSAWEYSNETDMYYLHLFSKKQPDLNWDNIKLRNSVYDIMRYWLDMGIDGFRMDVISFISKDKDFPDGKVSQEGEYGDFGPYVANGPNVHKYLKEMNEKVLSKYDLMTVGETPGATLEDACEYAGFDKNELNMIFQFEHMEIDHGPHGKWSDNRFRLSDLKRVLSKWQCGLEGRGWNSLYWNNHDQPRVVSRFGSTYDLLAWEKSAKMLATCLHMMQGTPYIYQGEEIGMTNVKYDSINEYRDLEIKNAYRDMVLNGSISHNDMMSYISKFGRDNARTPMQWDSTENAGFTTGEPWIKVNKNNVQINVKMQIEDNNSIFSYYKNLIKLRKENPIIVYGKYELIEDKDTNEQIFAYRRTFGDDILVVINNFTNCKVTFKKGSELNLKKKDLILCNYDDADYDKWELRPYESRVYMKKSNW